MCGAASATKKTSFTESWPHDAPFTALARPDSTSSGLSPPPAASTLSRLALKSATLAVKSAEAVTYSSFWSR
ncbi:hypothetical protein D3C72_2411510 [compost metagenome]